MPAKSVKKVNPIKSQKESGNKVPVADNNNESKKKKSTRKETKAGLVFPISKIDKRMKRAGWTERVGASAPMYIAAVIEYICGELVEAASNNCKARSKKLIAPRDVTLAVTNDSDLARLFAGVRVLVGDKIKGVGDELVCESDKRFNKKVKEQATAMATGEEEE